MANVQVLWAASWAVLVSLFGYVRSTSASSRLPSRLSLNVAVKCKQKGQRKCIFLLPNLTIVVVVVQLNPPSLVPNSPGSHVVSRARNFAVLQQPAPHPLHLSREQQREKMTVVSSSVEKRGGGSTPAWPFRAQRGAETKKGKTMMNVWAQVYDTRRQYF